MTGGAGGELSAKVALVTGAASGIGAAVAQRFEEEGAAVAVMDRAPVARGTAGDLLVISGDVSETADAERAVAETVQRFGRLDALVHCAGILRDAVLWKMSDAEWDEVLAVNLGGTFRMLRAAVPALRESGGGSAVLLASINGMRGSFGQCNYSAAKAGVIALARTAAQETGRFGIRVNAVAPGMIDTPMTRALPDAVAGEARERAPLARVGTAEEVADVAVFLCSERSRYVTGEVLRVDGGLLS